ncbi:hypothetical protein BGZ83_005081 [Gryganskiella cystojenkinii]|nr:hypothetical protein BGZ83_005081 [Gryganskiella cystojenkinii]
MSEGRAEIEKKRKFRTYNIFTHWFQLNHIIQRHESTIQKRWLKKNRQQRKALLLEAWPNMPLAPFNELHIISNDVPPENGDRLFWPHINQQELLKPKILLILLNARARHLPSAFAQADRNSYKKVKREGIKYPGEDQVGTYCMLFHGPGRDTPDTYGQIYPIPDPTKMKKSHPLYGKRTERPDDGLLVLEVQDRLYIFLLECCEMILHDMSRQVLYMVPAPIKPEPPALSLVDGSVNSLTALATMAPYRLPADLDLRRIQDLVAAKRSEMEDHIWSLREDPGYFADTLMEEWEHRPEALLDFDGLPHPLMHTSRRRTVWNRTVGDVVVGAHFEFLVWSDLHDLIGTTITLQDKYKREIQSRSELPEELMLALLDLGSALSCDLGDQTMTLGRIFLASPPLRAWSCRGDDYKIHPVPNPALWDTVWDLSRRQLVALVNTMTDGIKRQRLGTGFLLQLLDELFERDGKKIKDLISGRVTSVLENMSFLSECERQLSLYQPWASSFGDHIAIHITKIRNRHFKRTLPKTNLQKFREVSIWPEVDPTSGRFFYPVDKRRTKETTEAMQKAEKNLDAFWAVFDKILVTKVDSNRQGALMRMNENRTLHRTRAWIEPAPKTKQPKSTNLKSIDGISNTLSQLHLDSEQHSTTEKAQRPSPSKTKVKTKGVDSTKINTTNTTVATASTKSDKESIEDDTSITIPVDVRSFKVLGTLFYQPTVNSQPGEIPWNDFLYAMTNVGFAVEKLYGSVWHFSPSDASKKKYAVRDRSIQFHEPHPIAKIPYRMARLFGRRLFRAYGWRGEMFVLRDE